MNECIFDVGCKLVMKHSTLLLSALEAEWLLAVNFVKNQVRRVKHLIILRLLHSDEVVGHGKYELAYKFRGGFLSCVEVLRDVD